MTTATPIPKPNPYDPSFSYETDALNLFLFTSLTAGSSHIVTATSRLETILKANRVPYYATDLATDEKAKRIWTRRSKGKKLPGLVKGAMVVGDLEQVEEWNEFGEIKMMLGGTPVQKMGLKQPAPTSAPKMATAKENLPPTAPSLPMSTDLPIRTKEPQSIPPMTSTTSPSTALAPQTQTEPPSQSKPTAQSSLASEVAAAALKRKQDKSAAILRPKAGVDASKIRPMPADAPVLSPAIEDPPAPPSSSAGLPPEEAAAAKAVAEGAVPDAEPVEDALNAAPAASSGLDAVFSKPSKADQEEESAASSAKPADEAKEAAATPSTGTEAVPSKSVKDEKPDDEVVTSNPAQHTTPENSVAENKSTEVEHEMEKADDSAEPDAAVVPKAADESSAPPSSIEPTTTASKPANSENADEEETTPDNIPAKASEDATRVPSPSATHPTATESSPRSEHLNPSHDETPAEDLPETTSTLTSKTGSETVTGETLDPEAGAKAEARQGEENASSPTTEIGNQAQSTNSTAASPTTHTTEEADESTTAPSTTEQPADEVAEDDASTPASTAFASHTADPDAAKPGDR